MKSDAGNFNQRFRQFLLLSRQGTDAYQPLCAAIKEAQERSIECRRLAWDLAELWREMRKYDGQQLVDLIKSDKAFAKMAHPVAAFLDRHFLPILGALGEDYHKLLRGIEDGTLTKDEYVARGVTILQQPKKKREPRRSPVPDWTPRSIAAVVDRPLPPMPSRDAPVEHRIHVGETIIRQQREQVQALRQVTEKSVAVVAKAEKKIKTQSEEILELLAENVKLRNEKKELERKVRALEAELELAKAPA